MIGQEDPQRAGLVGVLRPCVSRVGVSCGHCARSRHVVLFLDWCSVVRLFFYLRHLRTIE